MDVLAREKVGDLAKHVFQEAHSLFVADVEHLLRNAPDGPYLIRLGLAPLAAQLGIGRKSGLHMAGEVYFRHYRDTAGGRVFYDVPDLVLSVEPAVAYAVVAFPVAAHHRAVAPGTDLGETGILVYLYPPALVFGEVPVEAVELIDGHHVQHLLHLLDAEEMPAAVEHQAAVAEPRRIGNLAAGKLALRTGSDRKHLANGLQCIEEAAKAACAHLCVFPSDAD